MCERKTCRCNQAQLLGIFSTNVLGLILGHFTRYFVAVQGAKVADEEAAVLALPGLGGPAGAVVTGPFHRGMAFVEFANIFMAGTILLSVKKIETGPGGLFSVTKLQVRPSLEQEGTRVKESERQAT